MRKSCANIFSKPAGGDARSEKEYLLRRLQELLGQERRQVRAQEQQVAARSRR